MQRRDFVKNMVGFAGLSILPSSVLGRGGNIPPSGQLTKGIIGVGSMGRGHFGYDGTRLVALCDVDANHLDAGSKMAGANVKCYRDYRDLIHDPDVDIVHIATPPHWHGIMAVEAAMAGKDIFLEKPMTRTIGEGKRVMEAVKQYGNILRLNTWFRFTDNFYGMNTTVPKIKKLVDSGMLGWPLRVVVSKHTGFDWKFYWTGKEKLETMPVPKHLDYDMWLGPAPYKPYNPHRVHGTFRGYWDYDGGGLGDMGQHYLDPVQYLLGKDHTSPISVEIDAPQQHFDAIGTWRKIVYKYEDGCEIVLYGEDHGAEDKAYIEGPNGRVFPNFKCDIPNWEKKLAEYPDVDPQYESFVDCIQSRNRFALNEANGFRSSTIVNMALVALRLGRDLKFDPVKLEFIGDDAANRLIDQPMRGPWTI